MILIVLPLFFRLSTCLEWVRFSVPEYAVQEDDVLLTCEFDVQGERLYSVKWYKSGREFYRYVPGEWPPQQAFNQLGVKVDVSRSDDQHVALENVKANSGGRYKCEVLTEAPLFKTLVKSQQMSVIELPEGQPFVSGGRIEYRPGDIIHLNCSAPKSRPPASLTWFINEQQAPSDYLIEYVSPTDDGGREAPLLGLRFKAAQWHFHNGQLNMRCAAKLKKFYVAEASHNGVVILPMEEEEEENSMEEVQFSSAANISSPKPRDFYYLLFCLLSSLLC